MCCAVYVLCYPLSTISKHSIWLLLKHSMCALGTRYTGVLRGVVLVERPGFEPLKVI